MQTVDNDNSVPSYNDVVRENQIESEGKIPILKDAVIIAMDLLLTCFFVGGFVTVRYANVFHVHMVNASQRCNDTSYRVAQCYYQQSYNTSTYVVIATTFLICIITIIIQSSVDTRNKRTTAINAAWHFWVLGFHFIGLSLLIHLLKINFGVLRPHFFCDVEIKIYYCSPTGDRSALKISDEDLRMSFPSWRSAIYGFCVTFVYLFIGQFDVKFGIHASQQTIILPFIYTVCQNMYDLWDEGENHLSDIWVGAFIGMAEGAISVRSMFGSVFPKHSLPKTKPTRPAETTYLHTNENFSQSYNLPVMHDPAPSLPFSGYDADVIADDYASSAPLISNENFYAMEITTL